MGWIVSAAIIALIAFLPVGISLLYDEEGFRAWFSIPPVRIPLYPSRKKRSRKKNSSSSRDNRFEGKKRVKKGGGYKEFLPILRDILELVMEFRRRLTVKRLELKLIMANADPCDLAVNYGRAWAAVGDLMPLLKSLFRIKGQNVEIECDFLADKMLLYVRTDIVITLGRLLFMSFVHGSRILKKYISILNQRKGGIQL